MTSELYRTYEVLVEESIHPDHPKRAKDKTNKESKFNAEIDGALRDTHMIFQDAVCYNTLCFAGLAGNETHKGGERDGELLNPLWKHLTTPAKEGGIKEETERVIRRLATHYKPLEGIATADEFLNQVYSEPLKIKPGMTEAERQGVLDLRAKSYRILEMFGAPQKESGGQECADMSAFANTWAGLTSKPDSDTEIPGNGAYDRVCRELKTTLTDALDEQQATAILEETFLRYSKAAEERNMEDCEQQYLEGLEECKMLLADAGNLPDADAKKPAKLKKAKKALEDFEKDKETFKKDFFTGRREGLERAMVSALDKPFATKEAKDIGLTEEEFAVAKKYINYLKYILDLNERKAAVADAEKLPDTKATDKAAKMRRLKKAKDALEKFEKETADFNLTETKFAVMQECATNFTASETSGKRYIRLHYKGGNPGLFEKAMFRYWLFRDDKTELDKEGKKTLGKAVLKDFREFIKKDEPDEAPLLDGEHIPAMPFVAKGSKIAFLLFGKMCLGIETIHSSPDWEFDKTAYATAAEDVFKYKIRTGVRKARVRKLLNVVEAYENKGATLAEDVSPTGKPLTIRGMDGDPRWKCDEENRKGIVQLLKAMSKEKQIGSYGLRESTIGGWAEVRKSLISVYRKAQNTNGEVADEARLVGELEKAVDTEMEANRQGFGSADFFHELCDPAYFHLWQSGTEFEHGEIKDFISHYASYCEWREELISLLTKDDGSELEQETELSSTELKRLAKKPIRYTWPGLLNRHKKPSYRYYDFAEKLNANLQLKCLFRRVRPADDLKGFPTYEKRSDDKAKLTLAARRLKRDKIINKDSGSSVDALWCPPLILTGEPTPTKENYPRAGKYEKAKERAWPDGDTEVSFSLIANPLPDDYWNEVAGVPSASEKSPVHLTVSFKIEADALALLQIEGVYFVGGSLKGVDEEDEKRKFFRWPVDIESDKIAAQEAAEKAKQAGQNKPPRKPDVKPNELWCYYDKGFRIKKSHYSKAEDTTITPEFHILAIDLGNRFAAAFARLRIHANEKDGGRIISTSGSPGIKAELIRQGTMRLQGECAQVWNHVRDEDGTCKKDANGNYVYKLEDETYGNGGRGRFPDAKLGEYEKFKQLARCLVAETALSLDGTKEQTYPELGDHLIFRLKRRIGRLRTLFNLVWRLCGKNERDNRTGKHDKPRSSQDGLFHKRMVVETLARSKFPQRPRQPNEMEEPDDINLRNTLAPDSEWQRLKDSKLLDSVKGAAEKTRRSKLEAELENSSAWQWKALAEKVKEQIRDYMEGMEGLPNAPEQPPLHKLLKAVVEFCLPLKGRHWQWRSNFNGERLFWDERGSAPDWNPNVMGMRGLSMKRLEQILNLRQRCQSFAKLEERYYRYYKAGTYDPPDSSRDERPDVCPLLLERSNRIREQRVDQTAHLILAEALGMELKNPAEVENKKERKTDVDLHGEYKRRKLKDKEGKEYDYPRCSVIILENLERYKTSQERTRSENSRLMKWAHRAIIEKLEDLCRPFGITLMLVDPAFSSHFDSHTGLPGVRVNQVSRDFEKQYPYNKWGNDKTKAGGETQLAKDITALAKLFTDNPDYKGDLILAVEGGKEFVSVKSLNGGESLVNADVGAAGNIGLRGIADPQRWDVFPRLRTERVSEAEVRVTNRRGWFGKLPAEERLMRAVSVDAATVDSTQPPAPIKTRKKGNKKTATQTDETNSSNNADSESGQSSEYPPFFVMHPEHDWLFVNDWLKTEAFQFKQGDKEFIAYPQGAYLKRVEQECTRRIEALNQARIQKAKNAQPP